MTMAYPSGYATYPYSVLRHIEIKKMRVNSKPELPNRKDNPQQLLKFVVRTLVYKKGTEDYLTHNQMASRVFGNGNSTNMGYLSEVTHHFDRYIEFESKRSKKYRFRISKISEEYPHFSDKAYVDPLEELLRSIENDDDDDDDESRNTPNDKKVIFELVRAIEDEIIASKEDRKKHTYPIKRYKQLKTKTAKGIYDLYLNIEADEYIKIDEGMPAQIRLNYQTFDVEILEFDNRKSLLTIHTSHQLVSVLDQENCKVVIDAVWLLEAIKKRLNKIAYSNSYPIADLLNRNFIPKELPTNNTKLILGQLDEFQTNAVNQSLTKSISLIWGPPGTGKSFTLAHLLVNSLIRNKRTLVCCIANVAVDSIAKKLIDVLEIMSRDNNINFKTGEVLRLGFTRDPALTKLDYLFPNSEIIRNLRDKLETINKEISKETEKQTKNQLQSKRTDLKRQLANEIKKAIGNSKIIFCTASKMHADSIFEELAFDNLIIDEASMMSVPHFVVLAENIRRNITITGDFRQLGPVLLSNSFMAQKWLYQDLFEFSGLRYKSNNLNHKSLTQLKTQRRFNKEICKIINSPFYKGELKSIEKTGQTRLVGVEPFKGKVIAYLNLSSNDSFKCELTSKHSRINKGSAKHIVDSLLALLRNHPFIGAINIGIVTPYRAQVNELNNLISKKEWPKLFTDKIKVGTIHSFQGSETDLLIFDLVESSHTKLGRLYMHETGERLVNVAISRAKSKLIIVGDIKAINMNAGSNNVRQKVFKVFENLKRYEVNTA